MINEYTRDAMAYLSLSISTFSLWIIFMDKDSYFIASLFNISFMLFLFMGIVNLIQSKKQDRKKSSK